MAGIDLRTIDCRAQAKAGTGGTQTKAGAVQTLVSDLQVYGLLINLLLFVYSVRRELEHKLAMEDREHENSLQQKVSERETELEVMSRFLCYQLELLIGIVN